MPSKKSNAEDDFESSEGSASEAEFSSGAESDSFEESDEEAKPRKSKSPKAKGGKATTPKATVSKAAPKKKAEPSAKTKSAGKTAPVAADGDPSALLVQYLESTNRPYNVQNIFDNLHGKVKKPAAEKLLKSLADAGSISSKDFGKSVIFWAKQDNMPVSSEGDLASMNADLVKLNGELSTLDAKAKELSGIESGIQNALDDESLRSGIANFEKENIELTNRLQELETDDTPVDPQAKENAVRLYQFALTEYRKRKRFCAGCVESVAEMTGVKPIQVIEDWGIERDEDVGFVLPEHKFSVEPASKKFRK